MSEQKSLICFGEVLWDMLPTGKVAGGAPMNVAFHAKNFGMNARLISCVGNDELGKELITFLNNKGIETDLIHTNYTFDTSTVDVTLSDTGAATYEIVQPVVWDFLYVDETRVKAVQQADYLLFGSLIGRSKNNIKHIHNLVGKAKTVIFDVNLRPPFYTQDIIEDLLSKADIVKMNEEELEVIAGWYGVSKEIETQMSFLMKKFNIETIIMTQGKEGAYCMHKEEVSFQPSFSVTVKDTVGSGDSFLAAFIYKMSQGATWQKCLEFACATGALVATKSGGTPDINEEIVKAFALKMS